MLNESLRWPNFSSGVVREKNKNPEEEEIFPIDPKIVRQELAKTFIDRKIGPVDWRKSQQLLEAVNSPEMAIAIYQKLDKPNFDSDFYDDLRGGRFDFLQRLTDQTAQDPVGFAMLEKGIEKPKLGVLFHDDSDGV